MKKIFSILALLLTVAVSGAWAETPNFLYSGRWYQDLEDAIGDACDNDGGTIYLQAGTWGSSSTERQLTISQGVSITFQPYNDGDEVIFDGQGKTYWFFQISNSNAHITFNDITFRYGNANQGGAIEVTHGQVTFSNCIFLDNKASQNGAGKFGFGGAIFLDESDASITANNCRFINNTAASGGGAVYLEDGAKATFNNCYFEGNTAGGLENHVQIGSGTSSSYSFDNCLFKGKGEIEINLDNEHKSIEITPDIEDSDPNLVVLYKDGSYYDATPWASGHSVTFSNLETGTYTIYMMKDAEKRYEYERNVTFSVGIIEAEVSLATEYNSTCYAGTDNVITVKAKSDKTGKYVIELLADGTVVDSTEIELNASESSLSLTDPTVLSLTDPTVRNIDEKTENGANNTYVVYAVNVKYDGIIIASANNRVPVLYNGNLGHDLEYGVKGFEEFAAVDFTGDIVIDIKDAGSYLGTAALNRTDVWNVQLTNGSTVSRAFVFIPYNWFNGNTYTENESMFNVTFNDKDIKAISYLRDQGNLGSYGKYGYGVFGYDVTDLIAVGTNTLVLNKNNPTPAVYPSVLVYMYDTEGSTTLKHASIINGADLLANSYNKAERIVKSDSQIAADLTNITNATLYVLAAGAQKGESNIIVNGRQYTDVWDGTGSTTNLFTADITDIVSETNNVSFVATGATILALPQIIVSTENPTYSIALAEGTEDADKWTATIGEGEAQTLPVEGLEGGETLTLTYSGTKRVKSVKAVMEEADGDEGSSTLTATFGTPGGNASYAAPTYTWTATTNNLMTCFEFSNGELDNYKTLTFKLSNLSGNMVRMGYYVGSDFIEFGNGYGSNGTKTVDLTALGIDLTTVTKIAFGGRTGTGSVDILASDVILSK